MRRLWLAGLCACGRVAFDPLAGPYAGDASDAGDAGVLPCGLAGGVGDDFEDGVIDDRLWGARYTNPGTSLDEMGGALILVPATSMASEYAALKTQRYFDMRGQRFIADVSQIPSAGTTSGIQIDYGNTTYASLAALNGNFRASYSATAFTIVATAPYDASHRFWSMREEGGELIYETSTDAVSFAELGRTPAPFDLSSVQLSVFAGASGSVASPGEMHVDAIGAPGTLLDQCPTASLVETFDTFEPRRWLNSLGDPCCSSSTVGAQLVLTTDGTTGNIALRSSAGFDLRGSSVTVELLQDPTAAGVSAALIVRYDSAQVAEITVSATQTSARFVDGATNDPMTDTRDPLEHWLRIREDQGTLYFEVSRDRSTWRLLRSKATPFPVADVLIGMHLYTTGPTGADTIRFDNLNAP